MKPNAYICGGFDLDCEFWDDVNGCWRDCKSVGGINCLSPTPEDDVQEAEMEEDI